MPLQIGANPIAKAYLGINEVPALYLGANEVFAGGSPPVYAGRSYQSWDDFVGKSKPVVPTSFDENYTFNSVATLQTALTAAGHEDNVGKVSEVLQTGSFTLVQNETVIAEITPGATVVLKGQYPTYHIDHDGYNFELRFEGNEPGGDHGYGAKAIISGVSYDGSGLGWVGDNAKFTFATAIPTGCAVGKLMKVWMEITNNTVGNEDPFEGYLALSRYPWRQRIGILCEVTDITGLVVTVDGHLYEGDTATWDQSAKSQYELYGCMQLSEADDVWVVGMDFRRVNSEEKLQFRNLRRPKILNCIWDQQSGGTARGCFEPQGCYETEIWDSVAYNALNVLLFGTNSLVQIRGNRRTLWKYSGEVGTPAEVLGFSSRNFRHAIDTTAGDYKTLSSYSDQRKAFEMGNSYETCAHSLKLGEHFAALGDHSGGIGTRAINCSFTEGQTGERVIGFRGCYAMVEDMVIQTSDMAAGSDDNYGLFGNSGSSRPSAAGEGNSISHFYQQIINCTLKANTTPSIIHGNRDDHAKGPSTFDGCTWDLDYESGEGCVWFLRLGQGTNDFATAYTKDRYPGYTDHKIKGDVVNINYDANTNAIDIADHAQVYMYGPTINNGGMNSKTLTAVAGDSTCKVTWRMYVPDKDTNTLTPDTGSPDMTEAEIVEAAAPTSLPAALATFTATANGANQIDLAFTPGGGDWHSIIHIEKSVDGTNFWQPWMRVGPAVTAVSDTGLTAETQYFYRGYAVNNIGASVPIGDNATTAAGGSSAEVTAVRAIMTNLTAAEDAAMETFVDGCVTDDNWSEIDVFVYYGLDHEGAGGDQTDWLGTAPDSTKGGTITKDTYDGWAKTAASANYIDTGIDLTADLTNADADSDIVLAVFMASTNDITTNNVSPFGVEASGGNPDRLQVIMRGSSEDKARVFPRDSGSDSGTGTYVSPFSGEWMGIILNTTADYIGGAPSSVVEAGIDATIGTGTVPSNNLYVGSNNKGNSGDDGVWACTMTALVIAKASGTFDLDAFSTRMATFKAAVDVQ